MENTLQTICELREPFASLWKGRDVFAEAFALKGEVFRHVKNRKTLRFNLDGKNYFIKIHTGVGWKEIFKNLFQLKKPVLGAENEVKAIALLEKLGVKTMTLRAYASRGNCPATRESFLITDEVTDRITLEDAAKLHAVKPFSHKLRTGLIRSLAETTAKMHFAGLNHRDCYLCHFMAQKDFAETGNTELLVMDLHRAEIRNTIPRRMRVKDLAGIFFSSMDGGFSRRDALRFIAFYSRFGALDKNLWSDVLKTAVKLYRKEFGRDPVLP